MLFGEAHFMDDEQKAKASARYKKWYESKGKARQQAKKKEKALYDKEYRAKNKERIAERRKASKEKRKIQHKAWCDANPEKVKAWKKAYYEANKEYVKAKSIAYYYANVDACKASRKDYREKNKEHLKQKHKDWYAEHRDERLDYLGHYRDEHREEKNAKARVYNKTSDGRATHLKATHARRVRISGNGHIEDTRAYRKSIYEAEQVLCIYCMRPIPNVKYERTVDHLYAVANGGGEANDNLAPACRSCNSSRQNKSMLWKMFGDPEKLIKLFSGQAFAHH